MIDVMLVLLIIFMIVTPLISSGFTATMPVGENVEALAEEDGEITLGIDNGGNYFVNGTPVTAQVAEEQLKSLFAARPDDSRLFFKADHNLPYVQGAGGDRNRSPRRLPHAGGGDGPKGLMAGEN
jgi:biopolymer transport protein TolR